MTMTTTTQTIEPTTQTIEPTTQTIEPTTQTQTQTQTEPQWFDAFPQELKTYVTKKGFKSPEAVTESYLNLEKTLGEKANMVKIPDSSDVEGMNAFFNKLGRPEKAEEYKVEFNKEIVDENFVNWAKGTFHKAGLTSKQVESIFGEYQPYFETLQKAAIDQLAAQEASEKAKLETAWGADFTKNMEFAKQAAASFDLSEEDVEALAGTFGFDKAHVFLHKLSQQLSEHVFSGAGAGGTASTNQAKALAEIESLKQDRAFGKKILERDAEAVMKWDNLHKIAFPSQKK